MSELAEKIIKELEIIDKDSVNMNREQIEDVINSLIEIAEKEQNEKWKHFLISEKLYYKFEFEQAQWHNLKAYEMDEEESNRYGMPQNYYIVNSLAVCYYSIGEFDKAIHYFSKAIELKTNNYQTYIDRATVYRRLGKYAQALFDANYVESKVDKNSELYFQAIESKGRTLFALGEYEEAHQILKSISKYKQDDAEYLEALAQSYVNIKDIKKAKKCYKKAYDICTDKKYLEYIKIKLDALDYLNKRKESTPFESSVLSLPKEQMELITQISNNNSVQKTLCQKYCDKYENEKMNRAWQNEDYILCLKGWSSSTPEFSLALPYDNFSCGGGFYIHFDGIGIVIDPGINYIESLHSQNLFIQDIDIVIVTHNHIDHNNDLLKIFDMSYQTGKEIRYYLDAKTHEKYIREIDDIEKRKNGLVRKIYSDATDNVNNIEINSTKKITLNICQTEHKCEGSFGFKIYLDNKIIGYTSDTKCTDEIKYFFKDVDIIIANISATNDKDILLKEQKETHLGVTGTYNILNSLEKENVVCLVSEFWGGLGDIRLELVKALKNYLMGKCIDIIPTDIGIVYFLSNNAFLCANCGKSGVKKEIKFIRVNGKIICICSNCSY